LLTTVPGRTPASRDDCAFASEKGAPKLTPTNNGKMIRLWFIPNSPVHSKNQFVRVTIRNMVTFAQRSEFRSAAAPKCRRRSWYALPLFVPCAVRFRQLSLLVPTAGSTAGARCCGTRSGMRCAGTRFFGVGLCSHVVQSIDWIALAARKETRTASAAQFRHRGLQWYVFPHVHLEPDALLFPRCTVHRRATSGKGSLHD
jgi:hypothetical protein